jgi:hypothetical protein
MTQAFAATIRNSRVEWLDPEGVKAHVTALEGKRVVITIQEAIPKRSLNGNAYLHGVVFQLIADETGYEMEEVKILMKHMFLSHYDRRGRLHVRGTSSLNRRQFGEFIEQVCTWAAMYLNVHIPPPETTAEAYAA